MDLQEIMLSQGETNAVYVHIFLTYEKLKYKYNRAEADSQNKLVVTSVEKVSEKRQHREKGS